MKTNTILCWILLAASGPALHAQSWGDSQPNGVRESTSTGLFSPGRAAFDGNPNTAWQLTPGSTSGWAERYWAQSQRLGGVTVDADLPAGVRLQLSALAGNEWVPIPGAVVAGPVSGTTAVTFPGELPPTSRLLVTLQGAGADQAKVWEITPAASSYSVPYGKILPQSYTINQNEYVNLKASRLWDGINGNAWFSPLWSLPQEAFQTDGPDQPNKIFPPYLGNPPQDAEIVWQLDGAYTIQTLKVFFIQNYQSVAFQFWTGSGWSSAQTFGAGWSDPGSGWQRIGLSAPVTTTKIRITFPGGWGRANAIGELEVWGQGFSGTPSQALVIPPANTDGSYHFTWTATAAQDQQLEVTVAGQTTAALTGEWNSVPFTTAPATWVGGDTVYRVPLAKETLRSDTQFLKLTPSGALHSVVMKDGRSRGQIDLGWPYSDGQFAGTQPGPGSVPAVKDKTWTLPLGYQLEKLRVYSSASNPGAFQTSWKGHATTVSWTSQGSGWWEASLTGITADQLVFHSSASTVLDEVQLWGTPLTDTKVGMEVWWPQNPVASPSSDGNSMIGWMGDPSVQPLLGGFHPRQADKLFWMPLAQMGMSPGQSLPVAVQGTLGTASSTFPYTVSWPGSSPVATLDQGTALASISQSSMTLSGTLGRPNLRVFVQGTEVAVVGSRFSTSVALKDGFQLLDVKIWDKTKSQLETQFLKPVYRTVGQPLLQFDLPPGDLWTQGTSLPLTGLVGNGTGLSLSLNGTSVPLTGSSWNLLQTLTQGTQALSFVLKDAAGRETDQTLTVNQDSAAPILQFTYPANGAYLSTSAFNVQVAGNQPQYWYSLNGSDWTPAYTQTISLPATLADGFYTYQVAAQDRVGNIGPAASVSFCVDTTPPVPFTIAANVTGWTNNNTPTLTFATTDATSGIDHYEYVIDTGGFTVTASPLTLPTLSDGVHAVYIKAVDKAGNSTLENIALSIDTVPPPTPTSFIAIPGADLVKLQWTGVDDGGGNQTYVIERSPAWPDGSHVTSAGLGPQVYVDSGLDSGSVYQYRVHAVDRAGNLSPVTDWHQAQVGLADVPVATQGDTIVQFNNVTLQIPAAAVPAGVTRIQVNQIPVELEPVAPSHPLVSPVYQLRVVTADGTIDHVEFLQPIAVAISYDATKLPAGESDGNTRPYYYDDIWGRWVPMEQGIIDTKNHEINFLTNHFSDFTVQATTSSEESPQQLRDVSFSPFGTQTGPSSIQVSPEGGAVSTSFTELVLPGKNGFNLVLKRQYDSGTAQADADPTVTDGSTPWQLGQGWRFDFPYMQWNSHGVWVKGLDGQVVNFGQTVLDSSPVSGSIRTVTLESHQAADATLLAYFALSWRTEQVTTYSGQHPVVQYVQVKISTFTNARLVMKDGRTVDYDSQGRVTAIADTTGLNVIRFDYGTPGVAKITDTMGRQVAFSGTSLQVSGGGEQFPAITYVYDTVAKTHYQYDAEDNIVRDDLGYPNSSSVNVTRLKQATDVEGRVWTYDYSEIPLVSKIRITNASDHGDVPRTVTTVSALTNMAGPGIGSVSVQYATQSLMYADAQEVNVFLWFNKTQAYSVTQDRLFASSVSTAMSSGQTPVRSAQYQFYLQADSAHHQFYTNQSVVDNGRLIVITHYQEIQLDSKRFSAAFNALSTLDSGDIGQISDWIEVSELPQTITTSDRASTVVLATQTMSFDPNTLKMTTTRTAKSASNFSETDLQYDGWGNVTHSVTTTTVGSATTTLTVDARYYNTGATDLSLDSGLGLTDNAARGAHTLLAIQKKNGGQVSEYTAFTYTSLGQIATARTLADDHWTNATYAYEPANGELVDTVAANGQETQFAYDYTSNPAEYTVTAKQKSVDLGGGTVKDLSTTAVYRTLTGTNSRTTDARSFVTRRTYDWLGRPTQIVEPAIQTDGGMKQPVTSIAYDDTALTSTVTAPTGGVTTYTFNNLGLLTQVQKTTTITSPLLGASSETVTTTLEYDGYDEVTAMVGPQSNVLTDATRTPTNPRTTYTYDSQGRIASKHAAGASGTQNTIYDDTTGTVAHYDELGDQTSQVVDWNGKPLYSSVIVGGNPITVSTTYDGAGRVLTEVDANGKTTTHAYNSRGLETLTTAPARSVWESGAPQSTPVAPQLVKDYDDGGNLKKTIQALEGGRVRQTVNTFNGQGKMLTSSTGVTTSSGPNSIVVRRTYDETGDILTETSGYADGTMKTKSWTYDSHGHVSTATDEEGRVTSYRYDLAGNRIRVTDPRQGLYPGTFVIDLTYDQWNRLIQAQMPVSDSSARPSILFEYSASGKLLTRQETDGQQTQYSYNARDLVSAKTITDGTTSYKVTQGWDDAGRMTSATSSSGRTDFTTYDEAGRVLSQGNDVSGYVTYAYNPDGTKKTVTDGRGNTTAFVYNPEGKVLKATDARGNVTSTAYDRWNQVAQTLDGENNQRTYRYDELGRLIADTRATGGTDAIGYDAWSNAVSQTDARGTSFTRTFSPANRLLTETAVNGATTETRSFTYDEAGYVKSATDNGVTTTYNTVAGSYQSNPYGLVTSKTDAVAGQTLTMGYTYDSRQRLTSVTNPDASTVGYTYNKLDQVTAATGWTGPLNYDAAGRLAGYTLANGTAKTVTYDSQDRVANLGYTSPNDTLKGYSFTYDQAGNIVGKNGNSYNYDELNQLIGTTETGWFQKTPDYVQQNAAYGSVDRDYQGANIVTYNATAQTIMKLDAAARSVGIDLGQTYAVTQVQMTPLAVDHRVRQQDLAVVISTDNLNYFKVPEDQWTFTANTDGSFVVSFTKRQQARYVKLNTIWDDRDINNQTVDKATFVNAAQQMIQVWVQTTVHTEAYEYDRNGNRTALTADGQRSADSYLPNSGGGNLSLLASDGQWTYTYDGNGNRITRTKTGETWIYAWDLHNRLKAVTKNGAQVASYTYDVENFRVAKTRGSAVTVYAYRQDGVIAYQKDLTTLTARTYTYIGSTTLGWTDTKSDGTKSNYFAVTDQVGSVTEVTDGTGTVVWSSEYLAFGVIAGRDGPYDFDGVYAGHEYDADVGLVYMWNRWQDPATGSFLSEDPAGQGTNWYAYAGNGPLNNTDPTGKFFGVDDAIFWSVVAVATLAGAYSGGVAVNQNYNPLQWDWNAKTFSAMAIGGGIGALTAVTGFATMSALGATGTGAALNSSFVLNAAISGAVTGFEGGFLNSWAFGNSDQGFFQGDLGNALVSGLQGAAIGFITGGIGGSIAHQNALLAQAIENYNKAQAAGLNSIDLSTTDLSAQKGVIVLNSPGQVAGIEDHTAILVQNPHDSNLWEFYTKDGSNLTNTHVTINASAGSFQDAIKGYNMLHSDAPLSLGYSRGISISTTAAQNVSIIQTLNKSLLSSYFVAGNNCADLVRAGLTAGGIQTPSEFVLAVSGIQSPNQLYNYLAATHQAVNIPNPLMLPH